MGAANCRSCKALIYWAKTKNGKNCPIDSAPSPEGNIVLGKTDRGDLLATVLGEQGLAMVAPGTKLYQSHFVTCPNRDQHRAKRDRKT